MKKIELLIVCILIAVLLLLSCKKEWLDAKPRDNQVVPTSISDAQALLDNNNLINSTYPSIEYSADDYELTYQTWLSLQLIGWKNAYIWNRDIWEGTEVRDWNSAYSSIFVSNVALETLSKIQPQNTNIASYNLAKGGALFIRAANHFNVANLFAQPYQLNGNNTGLGIPLRLSADVNITGIRSTLQQTYDQIIEDLKKAIQLLPVNVTFTTRPSKPAAYGLMARVFLSMGRYNEAKLYADSCLSIKNTLIDFNTLSITSSTPIPRDNQETIFYMGMATSSNLTAANLVVPLTIIQMYQSNDLRREIYFYTLNGKLTRKSSYTGATAPFAGIAVDEIYLIRSEARARLGSISLAMDDLNFMLSKRFKSGTFTPLTANNTQTALQIILAERRKELIYRGLRWLDLRRLNQEPLYATTLTRTLNGINYNLPPNDKRYTFAIPDIEIRSYGIEQNER